jgi:hypothetical protein
MKEFTLSLFTVALVLAAAPGEPPGDRDLPKWLDEQLVSVWPSAEEKRFDEIGWAKDIRAAEVLAKKHDRPVFLFTHDGHMGFGRC